MGSPATFDILRRRIRGRTLRAIARTGHPTNLAVFRIAVTLVVLTAPEVRSAPAWAALPPQIWTAPRGMWAWLPIPADAQAVRVALFVLLAGAAFGLVGLFTRIALAAATVAALYLLGMAQRAGAPVHVHHLVWFLAILATSPCGDVLSVDAALRAARGDAFRRPRPALAYALPLFIVWALVAMIFFFPGAWKLMGSGWAWIWSDNLKNQLCWKWLQAGFTPALRIDRWPLVCRLGAFAVVAFELSFGALVVFERTRGIAVACALGFHALTAIFMRLYFWSLWICYVAFIDAPAVLDAIVRATGIRLPRAMRPAGGAQRFPRRRGHIATALVGTVLIAGNLLCGLRGIPDAWPLACYPTFHHLAGNEMPALAIEAIWPDGHRAPIPATVPIEGAPPGRRWGVTFSLIGATDESPRPDPARLLAYYRMLAADEHVRAATEGATAVRLSRVWLPVQPEAWADPPRRAELLLELPLSPQNR